MASQWNYNMTKGLLQLKLHVAEEMRKARIKSGMTGMQVAKRMGVSPGAVSMWERAQRTPNFDDIERFSLIVRVPVREFFVRYRQVTFDDDYTPLWQREITNAKDNR
jgi:transcriptional regulator with XRE-family HTH domain